MPEVVAAGVDGSYVVVSAEHAHELTLFDRDGAYIETLGRSGEGPGEYAYVRQIRQRGSSLLLLDQQLNRLTVLQQGRVLNTLSLPFRPIDFLPLPRGGYVVNGLRATQANVGHPYHIIHPGSETVQSFGYDQEVVRFDVPFTGWRMLANAEDGFWAANVNRYRIEKWADDGTRTAWFDRDASWFPPLNQPVRGYSPTTPPPPMVRGIHELSDDLVLVAIIVPDDDFAQGLRRVQEADHDHYVIDDFSQVFDTVLEVIDSAEGRLISAARIDAYTVSLLESGEIATWRLEGGNSFVDLWTVHLQRR